MEDENRELPAPPRNRTKLYRILTISLLFLALFFSVGLIGLEATSSAGFCSSCHEMKPEYYTWKASSHAQVDCVNCHTEPGIKQTTKDKAELIVKALGSKNENNVAPIRMTKEIPNSTCEKCHSVDNREFSVTGDIIIPHDKHNEEDIKCTQCHNGVAHGEIPDRKMTFKTDYAKWDTKLGQVAMSDVKFTKPDMDTCMECHKSRDITTECSACHSTGMVPKSHEKADFKTKDHGQQAKAQLNDCNTCHGPMSTAKLEGYDDTSILDKYLKIENKQSHKDERVYSKENTFCQDCHNKRPQSHKDSFFGSHGKEAGKDEQKCFTCHDPQGKGNASKTVNCTSCHQMKHLNKWRENHPVSVGNVTKPQASCYQCHVKKTCTNCHKDSSPIKRKQP